MNSELTSDRAISAICDNVMRHVAGAFRNTGKAEILRAHLDVAVQIMRDEIKEFFFGASYSDARDCVMRQSLSDAWIIQLVAVNCVSKINSAAIGGGK